MRLMRAKIYRAFPELDRFSDEQCARFLRAANASWRRRMARWVVAAIATVVLLAIVLGGGVAFAEWVEHHTRVGGQWPLGVIGALLVIGTSLTMTGGMLLRDYLLRLGVRRVIRRVGTCADCGYSLLGMRVGENMRVICPECGRAIEVDPALGELSAEESGTRVYRPEVAREDSAAAGRRKRRHRRFFKWSAIAAASFAVLLAAAYGVWWWKLVEDAKVAKAERNTRARVSSLRAQMWPTGPNPESGEEFCRFVELVRAVGEVNQNRSKDPQYASEAGRSVGFSYDVLLVENTEAIWDKRNGVGTYGPSRRLVLDVLADLNRNGKTEQLREILSLRAPMRTLETDWREPFYDVIQPDLGMCRTMARTNAARMVVALYAGDRREYVDALEENLAAAVIVARQGILIEQLVGIAIESLTINRVLADHDKYPDDEWTREVLEAIERRSDWPEMWRSFEMERAAGLDAVQWFFSDPERVRRGQFGLGGTEMYGLPQGAGSFGWCGTYAANRDALNNIFDTWNVEQRKPLWKRKAIRQTDTGYAVVDALLPAISKASAADSQVAGEVRRCVMELAVDRYRWATGKYPSSVELATPYIAKKELLIDPTCGKPYRIGFMKEDDQPGEVFEIMHGNDDRPVKEKPGAAKPALKPATPKR